MGQLDHHGCARVVAFIGQRLHPAHHFVLVGQDIVEHRRAVAADSGGPGGHRQRHTRLGAFHVIGAVAVLWHAIDRIGRFMAGGHDPVAQRQVFQLKGLQQRIG